MRTLLVTLFALLPLACSKSPFKQVVAGERATDKEAVTAKSRIAAGSNIALACEVQYDAPASGVQMEAVWTYRPPGSSEEKVLHRGWGPRSGKGKWLTSIDTGNWKPGDYACTFQSEAGRMAAVIVVE